MWNNGLDSVKTAAFSGLAYNLTISLDSVLLLLFQVGNVNSQNDYKKEDSLCLLFDL